MGGQNKRKMYGSKAEADEVFHGVMQVIREKGIMISPDAWDHRVIEQLEEMVERGSILKSPSAELAGCFFYCAPPIVSPVNVLRDVAQKMADATGLDVDHGAFDAAVAEVERMRSSRPHANLATEIHADNVAAGWWTDLATGESTLHTRNRPEMLMLAVSEIAEAADGATGILDDKLPRLPMYNVELADFVIRQLDQIGAEVSCGHAMPEFDEGVSRLFFLPMSRNDRLMQLVRVVARAMEHYRKGRIKAYMGQMALGVRMAFAVAEAEHIDLLGVIEQKRAFNRQRADHKPENRVKEGGKLF